MRLPPSSTAWRIAACRRAASDRRTAARVERGIDARAPGAARRSDLDVRHRPRCRPGAREGFGAVRVVRIAEQAHAQFGLFQRRLASAVQADAAFVGGERFFQAHLAVFHLLHQLLELVERGFEIGDRGRLVFGRVCAPWRQVCGACPGGQSCDAVDDQRRRAPCASQPALRTRPKTASPAARSSPSRVGQQRQALALPRRDAELLQDVLERVRMRRGPAGGCVRRRGARRPAAARRSRSRPRSAACRRRAAAAARGRPSADPIRRQRPASPVRRAARRASAGSRRRPRRSRRRASCARMQQVGFDARDALAPATAAGRALAIQRRSTRARRAAAARAARRRSRRADRRCARRPARRASSSASRRAASRGSSALRAKRRRAAASVRAAAAARDGAGNCGRAQRRRCADPRSMQAMRLRVRQQRPRAACRAAAATASRARTAPRPHRGEAVGPGARAGRAAGRFRPGRRDDAARTRTSPSRSSGCEGRVARLARGAFQAEAVVAVDLDAHDSQRERRGAAHRRWQCGGPAVGVGMQAMVHVQRAQAARAHAGSTASSMQQDGRIQPAAEADQQRSACARRRMWRAPARTSPPRRLTPPRRRRSRAGARSGAAAARRPAAARARRAR